jgi:hypothetical protein
MGKKKCTSAGSIIKDKLRRKRKQVYQCGLLGSESPPCT